VLTERAFGELYQATLRPLWTYVYRVTRHAADTDDIVQEAFLRALRADIAALSAEEQRRYLFTTASHLVVDRWRRDERERSWAHQVATEPQIGGPAPADDVTSTFQQLKARDRALLWLAYVEQQTHEEIAAALALKRNSVKVLLARARAALRDLLMAGDPHGRKR
jgi:RNA polymerase sigma factor (sigma-70 family)